ncbi:MAG TPA: hypothetical protein VKU94_06590 [Geobacterales bacterium]|nr:hypothetical protein [Geobacterales bacterium]
MTTSIEEFKLTASSERIKLGEKIKINLSMSIKGDLVNNFTPDNWEKAYKEGERKFMLRYFIKIKNLKGFLSSNDLIKEKIVRRAVFFWTRNPTIDRTYWVELVLEDKKPYLIREIDGIYEKLFNLERSYEIDSNLLGDGKHKIRAEVKVKWANYVFIDASTLKAKSNVIAIECLK